MKIILATTSQNRLQLFNRLGVPYEAVSPDYQEHITQDQHTTTQVEKFAQGKAQSVYQKISEKIMQDFCIIGFDSMVELNGKSIGKAANLKGAFAQIQSFRGKTQKIHTGISLIGKQASKPFEVTQHETTTVQFRSDYTEEDIHKYLAFDDWQGKCGSYSILGTGLFLIKNIEGDFQNIIGVPVLRMQKMLEKVSGKKIWDIFEKRER